MSSRTESVSVTTAPTTSGSSAMDGYIIDGIAAAVALPVVAAFGAGWLAWKTGKLFVDINRAVDEDIKRKRLEKEAAMQQQRIAAVLGHRHLLDVCRQFLNQCKLDAKKENGISSSELQHIESEINKILSTKVPADTGMIESITARDFLILEKLIQQKEHLLQISPSGFNVGKHSGLDLANLMEEMRISFSSATIKAQKGTDIHVDSPEIIERSELREEFLSVAGRVIVALEHVSMLEKENRLTEGNHRWFESCFNGVDNLLAELCDPSISNIDYKKGILQLKETMERYDMVIPSINKEFEKMKTLYEVYVSASRALNEPCLKFNQFKSSKDLEERLSKLTIRAERAEKCAKIYQKVGRSAYISYALDQELKALGYSVHSRQNIIDQIDYEPQRFMSKVGELPFYQWGEDSLTQLYSLASQCSLQVVVQEDGTFSMQTIAHEDNLIHVQETQEKHCEALHILYDNLKKNWFICHDFKIIDSAEKVTDLDTWKASERNAWKTRTVIGEKINSERRKETKGSNYLKRVLRRADK